MLTWLCRMIGHRWNRGRWNRTDGDKSWHAFDFCERCHKRQVYSTQIKPLADFR